MSWSYIKSFYLREITFLRQNSIEEALEKHQFFNIKYSPNLAWSYENDHFNYKQPPNFGLNLQNLWTESEVNDMIKIKTHLRKT